MLAPIDAKAEVVAGDDRITLRLNMRTLALAKANGVNLIVKSLSDVDPLELASVVSAFAMPDQPDFNDEQAFALIVRYPSETREALASLSSEFAAEVGDAKARPTKPVQRKPKATS